MLLIGATGKVGQNLVPLLTEAGVRPTVLVRDAVKAQAVFGSAVDYVEGDLADPTSLDGVFAGHDVVYLASGGTDKQAELEIAAVNAAAAAGVKRIVKISSPGSNLGEQAPITFSRWNGAVETAINATSIAPTYLRPSMFMTAFLGSAGTIAQGQYYSTNEDAKLTWVHPADIAAVAARALLDDAHANKAYSVTGPEALSGDEVAAEFSAVLGKPVQHIRIDDAAFKASLESFGLPQWTVDAYVEMSANGVRPGVFATVSQDVLAVTGNQPRTLASWIEENKTAFEG
jgi:uncharacterized protein YbjT (DUF2867 family)